MKKTKFFAIVAFLLLAFSINTASAQYFCFFVDNQSDESFNELKIRPSGKGNFGKDLLPSDLVESGKHFWVKTGNDKDINYDVQITNMDGSPLLFSWTGVDGNFYANKPFITLNVRDLHTLVIGSDENGNLTFSVHNDDAFNYGHPCQ
ncbi:MAG: hypothetical protein EAZ97_14520 [Bacteroidetes bacterium]|nr:MAG: hypothetical protein EAZ97_14520 [Bacteroidota bacterium]